MTSLPPPAPKQRLAWKDPFYQFSLIYQSHSADQQILDSHAWLHRVLIRRSVSDDLRIEDNYIRICSLLQAALKARRGR